VGWSVRAAKSSAATPTTTESHIATGPLWPSFSTNGAAIKTIDANEKEKIAHLNAERTHGLG